MNERALSDDVIENLIIWGMITDEQYTASVITSFNKRYFDESVNGECFEYIKKHFKKFNKLPPKGILQKEIPQSEEIFKEIESIDYDIAKNYDHLFEETNLYLKEKAFKMALLDGVDLIEAGKNPLEYKNIIEEALSKDLKIELGTDYWNDLGSRLIRVFTATDVRVPTLFPKFDEYIGGGFPPYTLSVILSKIHGGKTNFVVNVATRQSLAGINPLIISLEMSEDALCQRFDSIYSKLEINSMYIKDDCKKKLYKELRTIKENQELGDVIIKELPPGKTNTQDIEAFLRELKYRKKKVDIIYIDYLQLLGSTTRREKRHEELKHISEELRTISLNHQIPVVSVGQLNKEGIYADFDNLDYTFTAGSIDIAATADFMAVFGRSEDDIVYESEMHYKITKNRLGGRVGDHDKLYIDKNCLKMYDETELRVWIEDAKITGDYRTMVQKD